MASNKHKGVLLIMLVVLPLLVAGPVSEMALSYLEASQNLSTYMRGTGTAINAVGNFLIDMNFSLDKTNFADKYMTRTIGINISGNYTPSVRIGQLSTDHHSWNVVLGLEVLRTRHPGAQICGFSTSCLTYSNSYQMSESVESSNDQWDQFGALYSPLDWYQTPSYCILMNGSYVFGSGASLTYNLPPGYRAGLQDFVLAGSEIPKLDTSIPAQNRLSCFSIAIARDPLGFIALVLYSTIPLIILWYVAVITYSSVTQRKDRLQIYVGALFASFAYFFSVRQHLQSIVTVLDVFTVVLMTGWILSEAAKLLLE